DRPNQRRTRNKVQSSSGCRAGVAQGKPPPPRWLRAHRLRPRRTIGVLGGMGPAATALFFRRLIEATSAKTDQEHLHVVIDSDPSIPDRTKALLEGGPSPAPQLIEMARRLQMMGAELIVMPCNTAHVFA